jgi:hypothetical protein
MSPRSSALSPTTTSQTVELLTLAAPTRGAHTSPTVAALPPPPVVSFVQLPAAWRSFQSENGAYATSWAYRPDSHGWARHMPRNGITVTVLFPTLARSVRYPPLRLVLPRRPAVFLEGTRDTPEYRIRGRVKGRNALVMVDVRNPHPTAVERRLAQRVLAAIRFG